MSVVYISGFIFQLCMMIFAYSAGFHFDIYVAFCKVNFDTLSMFFDYDSCEVFCARFGFHVVWFRTRVMFNAGLQYASLFFGGRPFSLR